MIPRKTRTLLSLALGLTASVASYQDVQAATITTPPAAVSLDYSSSGTITNNGVSNLISFNGMTDAPYNNNATSPTDINNQLNFGNFLVSNSVDNISTIKSLTTISDPFQITNMTDASNGYVLKGTINGTLGNANPANDNLAATISSVTPIGTPPLTLAVPIGVPINLNLANGMNDGSTALNIGATPGVGSPVPAPEPASIAMFAVLVGGLGVWHRRRAGR
jgi:hypothetical protein